MTYGITVKSQGGQLEAAGYGDIPDGTHEISGHDGPLVQVTGGATSQDRSIQVARRDPEGRTVIGAQHYDQRTTWHNPRPYERPGTDPGRKERIMRYFTRAATALALLGALIFGAGTAHAATPGCQAVPAGACSSWQAPVGGGVNLDVWQQRAASNAAIKVYKASAADPAEDFQVIPVADTGLTGLYPGLQDTEALAKAVNLEYAPNGIPSGFCVSIVTSTERADAALRPCDLITASNQTFNQYQTFNVIAATDGDGSFVVFQSVLTGFVLNVQHGGGSGSAVISYAEGADGSTPQQLWQAQG